MRQIPALTDSPYQQGTFILENGQPLQMTLWYSYNQQGWYYSFTYQSYTINNRRVVNSANMLRQIRNIIPFGIACLVTDLYEPVFINDFSSGRVTLYTLNPTDVALVESNLAQLQIAANP